jgi:hypothetical protein
MFHVFHMTTPRHPTSRKHNKFLNSIMKISAVAVILLCVRMSTSTSKDLSSRNNDQDTMSTNQDTVSLKLKNGEGENKNILEYIHCGPLFRSNTMNTETDLEILMLHGAAFKKEDWVTSGILNNLCFKGGKHISITAIDLSVRVNEEGLEDAFQALVHAGVLSGLPVVMITPSASGKSVVSLAYAAFESENSMHNLQNLLKIWIPVASPAVLSVQENEIFSVFSKAGIDILAIHGDQDEMGKKVTKTLEKYAGAKGVQLNGRHPCYLDSPTKFVQTVYEYLRGEDVS